MGTEAAPVLELANVTTSPDGPALPFRLTVPVTTVAEPPTTVVGDTVTDKTPAGRSVRFATFETAPRVAVTVVGVFESTPLVGTRKLTEVAPARTVTDTGGTT